MGKTMMVKIVRDGHTMQTVRTTEAVREETTEDHKTTGEVTIAPMQEVMTVEKKAADIVVERKAEDIVVEKKVADIAVERKAEGIAVRKQITTTATKVTIIAKVREITTVQAVITIIPVEIMIVHNVLMTILPACRTAEQ
jgi:hypothetical protein